MGIDLETQLRSPFFDKLKLNAPLDHDDERALRAIVQPLKHYDADTDIFVEGDTPYAVLAIMSGWACRYKTLASGKRQIVALLLPGDLTEPFGALPDYVDYSLVALTSVMVAPIAPAHLRHLAKNNAHLESALWRDLLMTQAANYERMLSLGRRTASERLGHLFCELYYRLKRVNLVADGAYDLPMVQSDMADLLGLSTVHVNRSLQELRASRMISLIGRRLKILDLEALEDASFFVPSAFNLDRQQSLGI